MSKPERNYIHYYTMKNINKICLILLLLITACQQNNFYNEYENLPNKGSQKLSINQLTFDTITIDGTSTSLEGQWLVNDRGLYFADFYMVGISEFDLNGNFKESHIEKGRGPHEALSPFVASTFSSKRELIGIDMGWLVHRYDTLYKRQDKLYKLLSDIKFEDNDWDRLLGRPDPEIDYMYEFNVKTKKIKVINDTLLIPILTEHIHYNGYNIGNNTEDFWAESYIFQMFDIKQGKTLKKFGNYSPIYRRANIPLFSTYNFDVSNNKIFTSFAVDSLIYVRDLNGKLLYSFGFSSGLSFDKLLVTSTLEEYERAKVNQLPKYAYFTDLFVKGDYVLRGYKKEGKNGYGLQIYRNCDLIGDIPMKESFKLIGEANGFYYLLLPVDLDNECFKILKFKM